MVPIICLLLHSLDSPRHPLLSLGNTCAPSYTRSEWIGPTRPKPCWGELSPRLPGLVISPRSLSCCAPSSSITAASIVLVVLIFHFRGIQLSDTPPTNAMSVLQHAIAALSVTIVSAVIMVAGKRFVFFKLTRRGIRSQRVAVYASPSIGNLTRYLVYHGSEPPLLALLATWVLGLATALTVANAWTSTPFVHPAPVAVPFSGPFNASASPEKPVDSAIGQLTYVMGSVCSGVAGSVGLIKIGGDLQLTSGGQTGITYYPPLPYPIPDSKFSFPTSLNSFNISMESLSSVPSTAQNLSCVGNTELDVTTGQLWYEASDNETLSIIATASSTQKYYRFNASAIIIGGTLQSTSNAVKFVPNGTSWQNVMQDDQWAQGITSLLCNTTQPSAGSCSEGFSLYDYAVSQNALYYSAKVLKDSSTAAGIYWSTALGMAMGAYSSAWYPGNGTTQDITISDYDNPLLTLQYGVYVLIANIVVSAVMLVVVVKLRMATRLGADFINATRLLLNPLKNPELFNTTLEATVEALGNPYMSVSENNEFLLTESPPSGRLDGEIALHNL